jgi:DNA-binding transcriptional MerR regulator
MSQTERQTYRTREFAALAGVTVRALHHYDRLGLLEPKRGATGYRVYCAHDLETLEQIVALKFIGLPLKAIKLLLRRSAPELAVALRAQRAILEQKKRLLEQAIGAIGDAEKALQSGSATDGRIYRRIIEVIEMQDKTEDWKQQYDALVKGKLERLQTMTSEDKATLRAQFADLFKQVEATTDEDPASPRAQELATRYIELLRGLTLKGELNPQLQKIVAAYLSSGEWPTGAPPAEPAFGGRRVWEFMARAVAARL